MSRIMQDPPTAEESTKQAKERREALRKLTLEIQKKAEKIRKAEESKKEKAFIREACLAGFNVKQAKFIYSQIMLKRNYHSQGPGSYVFNI